MSPCRNCGTHLGFEVLMCAKCGHWAAPGDAGAMSSVTKAKVKPLDEIEAVSIERIVTGGPWDEAWGGGVVPTSVSLIGGTAGCGKSTMLIQMASVVATLSGKQVYFLSAEQAPGELRLMANRLQIPNIDRILVLAGMGGGAELDDDLLRDHPPGMFVVDSVSALCGKDKYAALAIAKRYKLYATRCNAPAFLVCHITKMEGFAGLMALQHEVDSLIAVTHPTEREAAKLLRDAYVLDEEALNRVRVLAAFKNRYGPTSKDFYLEMTERGLVALPPPPPTVEKKRQPRALAPIEDGPEVPRRRARAAPPPDVIDVDGQRLVRKAKKPVRGAQP